MDILKEVELSNNTQDKPWWKQDSRGVFSVKSFSKAVWEEGHVMSNLRGIWYGLAPPRAELLLWFAIQEKLNTRNHLRRLNLIRTNESSCPFCENEEKTGRPLFLHCTHTWIIWTNVLNWWKIQIPIAQSPEQWFEIWKGAIEGGFQRKLWISLFFVIFWSLWD